MRRSLLNLTGAANADLGLSSAVWTIVDDDPAPVFRERG